MVAVKLMGGLGNQMFQYAAGKALASRLNTICLLDTGFLDADPKGHYTKRHYELSAFEIQQNIASADALKPFLKHPRNRYTLALQRSVPGLFNTVYFYEKGMEFQPAFNKLKGNVYLDGYWQSERYFQEQAVSVRKDFTCKGPVPAITGQWHQKIRETYAVSLHIRRGDYISSKTDNEFHGTCTLAYYEAAIAYLKKYLPAFEVFLFSDDPEWCSANIHFTVPTHIVTQPDIANHWDLYLMASCRHHIIANSSFSWWGAWLNPDMDKQVIAPQKWFATHHKNTKDLIPASWIRL
ncbi:MAG: alpha-1,2-fucosyltransferase [Bacteroidetes bacterium]|nr:alpha-1,2-fucosyltransferase [Bacteroidota bacterium]